MRLDGKTAIVTGGAMGIGQAIARGYAAEGASVVIADLKGAEGAAGELTRGGATALGVDADVTSERDMHAMVEAAVDAFGGVDVLVNNAGIYASLTPGPFEDIDAEEWRQVMDANVLGPFLAARAVVPAMRRAGGGRIINMASGTPFKGVPYLLHYTSSKGAVVAFTRALAKELGGDDVLVNAIAPGFTLSDGVEANPVQIEKLRDISRSARTLQRDQFPEDIVGAAIFFASDDSTFITGQSLLVDGGAYFN
ncbi:SDR family oxidoreductase [Egibacter rhizosphaerae]|uniref:SDR family oxidoreductase n=1 Tax=Egibacter rhizosphaerae TaxID=1670831 RepID=A0A411YJQ9_9ACTN|nr:SDR family oxidoreductase [Egibacter rhizosphaerae]QBI21434.1 SDR family oxidoreductase [Egibacter rhizosphaerae]